MTQKDPERPRRTKKDPEGPRRTNKDPVMLSKLGQTSQAAFAASSFSSWFIKSLHYRKLFGKHLIALYWHAYLHIASYCVLYACNVVQTVFIVPIVDAVCYQKKINVLITRLKSFNLIIPVNGCFVGIQRCNPGGDYFHMNCIYYYTIIPSVPIIPVY